MINVVLCVDVWGSS